MGTAGSARTIGVAIAVPEPYAAVLQGRRESYGDPLAMAIPTHITLLPPTPVHDEDLSTIEAHLRKVALAEEPFVVQLRGTGTFRPISAVVFVELELGSGDCERIEGQVRSGPLARPLAFHYHPHVTVAHNLPDAVLERAFTELAGYEVRFRVWGLSLHECGPDGVWRPQRDFPFGQVLPGPQEAPGSSGGSSVE
jgi:2'-5' RNA ligase